MYKWTRLILGHTVYDPINQKLLTHGFQLKDRYYLRIAKNS